jgi:hypothetical protein
MKKTVFSALAVLLLWMTACSQMKEIQRIDDELTATFKKLLDADIQTRYDSLAPLFKKQLIMHLANAVTFNNSLANLSKYVHIQPSADKKLKFYSWDDLTGGTWHYYTAVAQFLTDEGKIGAQCLNIKDETGTDESSDCIIYEVHDIAIDGVIHYLTFGRGTHASGYLHDIIRIFKISGSKLMECDDCFAPDIEGFIAYPRIDNPNLAFNPKTNEITYNEFQWDDETGSSKPTGKIITLKLINGKFMKK